MLSIQRAKQFYMENRDKFPGMTMSDAVTQLVRSNGLPGGATPPAGPMAAPVPIMQQVSPQAAAVPMAPPPEVVVEQPEEVVEDYTTPAEAALAAFNAGNPIVQAAPAAKGAKVDYAARAKQAAVEAQRNALQMRVEAEKNAEVDPRIRQLLDERVERTTEELENVDKDRQQAIWMAIAQAGMKMAQSQSPYFMQALASGMEAGLGGYSEAKAKAAEKKARLQETKEDLALKMIELETQARRDAVAGAESSIQTAAALQGLEGGALKNTLAGETIDDAIEAAGLQNQQTRAQIANIYNTIGARNAASARAERAARAGGGGGGVKLSQLNPIVNGAISENDRLREMINDPLQGSRMTPQQKAAVAAKIAENDRIIAYGRSLQKQKIGMGSGFRIID